MNWITGKDIRVRGASNIENCQIIGGNDIDVTEADSNKTNIRNGSLVVTESAITANSPISGALLDDPSWETGNFSIVADKNVYFVDTSLGDVDVDLIDIGRHFTIIKTDHANKVTFSTLTTATIEINDLLAKRDKVIVHYDLQGDIFWGLP